MTAFAEAINFGHLELPFDVTQGGESFDVAQDPEVLEGPVEPFRASDFVLPVWGGYIPRTLRRFPVLQESAATISMPCVFIIMAS